jgi:hypothetical protein
MMANDHGRDMSGLFGETALDSIDDAAPLEPTVGIGPHSIEIGLTVYGPKAHPRVQVHRAHRSLSIHKPAHTYQAWSSCY